MTAADIREAPHRYVLQLGYYRFQNLVDVSPPPSLAYVRAQTKPFNVEMEFSEGRLFNWLRHFGINAENGHEPIQIHANGHACGVEIQAMVDKIELRVLVPIHTEKPDLFENESGWWRCRGREDLDLRR